MRVRVLILTIMFTGPAAIWAQHTPPSDSSTDCPLHAQNVAASPYAGQQSREIKALSTEEREQLLSGHGMGLSRVAELNGFPGPKHVLELSASLSLSEVQQQTAQQLFDEMLTKAQALGREIVDAEAALDALFTGGAIDQEQLAAHVLEIGRLKGQLRLAHLEAHVRMHAELDDSQATAYDRLRGYR